MEQRQEVLDLGITITNKLKLYTHIAKISTKVHGRVNLIIRCLMSRDISYSVKAFRVFVRQVLEYFSIIWCPYLIKDIIALEGVQRRSTKRLPCTKGLT